MDLRFERRLRPIAAVILFFFTFYCIEPLNFAAYAQTPSTESQNKSKSAEEEFQEAIEKIRDGIDQEDTNKIKTGQGAVERLDVEIKQQFKATENEIRNLPDVIKQRHKEFVKQYEENLKALKSNLDEIKRAKTKTEKEQANKKTKAFLEKTKSPSRHTPLDPNNLPHRTPKVKERKPRLKKEDFAELQTPVQLAFAGSDQQLLALITPDPSLSQKPTPADLTETIEVQFTPEITALAEQLEHNPVKIYNYVRNNIDFVPTYGSIQGANMCLMTKQCNDMDTASLLIALLRASGISSRYVIGTIEVPIDKVMNWVGGFTDAQAALNFISSGGTPIKSFIEGGKIAKVQMEHAWVEAYVDYIPSRGAINKQGDTWIPLDASFKQHTFTNGIDFKTAVPFDADGFVNQLKSTATIDPITGSVTNVSSTLIQNTLNNYQAQLQDVITKTIPNVNAGNLLGKKSIVPQNFSILAASLPYKVTIIGSRLSELSDGLRHKVTFTLQDQSGFNVDISVTKALPEIAGQKVTLSYGPASSSDESLLLSYVNTGATSLPAYLIRLKPELRINGLMVASGSSIAMGELQPFDMILTTPTIGSNLVSNTLTAGTYSAIAFDLGVVVPKQLENAATRMKVIKQKLETSDFAGLTKDDIIGEFVNGIGMSYWGLMDLTTNLASRINGVMDIRLPSEGIFTQDITVHFAFGIPFSAVPSGFSTDIDLDYHVVFAKDGDQTKPVTHLAQTGMLGSNLEASIYDLTFNKSYTKRGISAAHILEHANSQGIPIYTVDKNNISSVLPALQVSNQDKTDVQNAVAAGLVVTIPKTEITKDGWTGTGYVSFNPITGAGAYIISGGLAGGGYSCKCFLNNPVAEFLIGIIPSVLVFASFPGLLLAIVTIAVITTLVAIEMCEISSRNDLNIDQQNTLIGITAGKLIFEVLVGLIPKYGALAFTTLTVGLDPLMKLIGNMFRIQNQQNGYKQRRKGVYAV
ncbi:MAG: transglutaminase [Nitrospirae bacterium]|nr:transglutaminase [Candidatus Troglogloeales bacterium]